MVTGPISDPLQDMMEELQGYTDWYYEENNSPPTRTQPIDLTTPPQAHSATMTPASSYTQPILMRLSVSRPQADADGFVPVGGNGTNTPHHADDL